VQFFNSSLVRMKFVRIFHILPVKWKKIDWADILIDRNYEIHIFFSILPLKLRLAEINHFAWFLRLNHSCSLLQPSCIRDIRLSLELIEKVDDTIMFLVWEFIMKDDRPLDGFFIVYYDEKPDFLECPLDKTRLPLTIRRLYFPINVSLAPSYSLRWNHEKFMQAEK
jgi:hypothetical protein